MKIGIIGSGISGLTAAYLLNPDHEITVFEKEDRIGGHTNTVRLQFSDSTYFVDTGFIVFNERTYPNFIKLLKKLDVTWQNSDMSFSVSAPDEGIEYSSKSLGALFACRRNIWNIAFWRMLIEILRFRNISRTTLEKYYTSSLDTYLQQRGYSRYFKEYFLYPMGASIWSAEPGSFGQMPLGFFFRFFENHGLLTLTNQPQWLTIQGGSQEYVKVLTVGFEDRVHLNTQVKSVHRESDAVVVRTQQGEKFLFDHVIIAAHSDQALAILKEPTASEQAVLSAIDYQLNRAVLHSDTRLLPQRRNVWSSWNYKKSEDANQRVAITYWMNSLQSIDSQVQFCVTLNQQDRIDPNTIYYTTDYEHPVYHIDSVAAQQQHNEISGKNRIHFCGAYWGNGFHEDGVNSALAVCRYFGKGLD
jgi:predicted NAD/FAD-binding protein